MSERVQVVFHEVEGSRGAFTRYYSRDVVALLTKWDIVYLDDTPWAVGHFEIIQRIIAFDPTAERLETVTLVLRWRSYHTPMTLFASG